MHDTEAGLGERRSVDIAALVFLAVLVAALVLFVVFGRSQWFYHDEWDFLVERNALDLHDLFRPHNEHWTTLPILIYRVLWHTVGLRSYLPYQLIAIGFHLTTAVLLRVVMRRAAVNPWIATAAASLFALFGAGDRDILPAFQMVWGASLVLGLTHLILADHDGRIDRRDVLGLCAGTLGLLCSGVAVTMVFVVGVSALVRRGWRAAVFHSVPLGVLYLFWWFAFARDQYSNRRASHGDVFAFVWSGLTATFRAMGQVPGIGIALGFVVVAGLGLAWQGLPWEELRRRAAAPSALLIGAVVFFAVAALGRVATYGPQYARESRYLHVGAALCLPAIAVAVDGFLRRWRAAGVVAAALVLVGIPGNINLIARYESKWPGGLGHKDLILALPKVPFARDVPSRLHPMSRTEEANPVTIGWLLRGVDAGRIHVPEHVDRRTAAQAAVRLSLLQSKRATQQGRCEYLVRVVSRTLKQGEAIRFAGPGNLRVIAALPARIALIYIPAEGQTLIALHGPLTLQLASASRWPFLAALCA